MRLSIIFITTLVLAGCSDDTTPAPTPDKPSTVLDKGPGNTEASGNKEASAGTDNCKQMGECQKLCGVDLNCLGVCKTKGCTAAQTAMDAIWACATTSCAAGGCLQGFSTACETCLKDKCKSVYDACQAQTCP